MTVDIFGNPAFENPADAITVQAISAWLGRHQARARGTTRPQHFWCRIATTNQGVEGDCARQATTFAASYGANGVWQTTPMCAFHANRAGKGNVATLETILQAAKDAS